MAGIEDYIRTVFFVSFNGDGDYAKSFNRRSAIELSIVDALKSSVANITEAFEYDYYPMANAMFDEFVPQGIITEIPDEYAGSFFKFVTTVWQSHRQAFLQNDEIYSKAQRVGSAFLPAVFESYVSGRPQQESFTDIGVVVPASDRIVTLLHNQIDELDKPLSEFEELLVQDNGIPDRPGLKERLLGQVRAGHELIKAGTFKAYLVYATLLMALNELASRYKDHVIGAAAGKLIELLIEYIFTGGGA